MIFCRIGAKWRNFALSSDAMHRNIVGYGQRRPLSVKGHLHWPGHHVACEYREGKGAIWISFPGPGSVGCAVALSWWTPLWHVVLETSPQVNCLVAIRLVAMRLVATGVCVCVCMHTLTIVLFHVGHCWQNPIVWWACRNNDFSWFQVRWGLLPLGIYLWSLLTVASHVGRS